MLLLLILSDPKVFAGPELKCNALFKNEWVFHGDRVRVNRLENLLRKNSQQIGLYRLEDHNKNFTMEDVRHKIILFYFIFT